MDNDFGSRVIITMLLGAGISGIAWITRWARKQAIRSRMPPEPRLRELATMIKKMRRQGGNYAAQLNLLLRLGVDRGVAETILVKIEAGEL